MFALAAAIIWFLAAFGVSFGRISPMFFGLAFLALHLCFSVGLPMPAGWRRQPPG